MSALTKKPPMKQYFLTAAWRGEGIIIGSGAPAESGAIWGVWVDDRGREHHFWGRLGASVFETREAANEAVKKKATSGLKRMRKELARIEAIAADGVA